MFSPLLQAAFIQALLRLDFFSSSLMMTFMFQNLKAKDILNIGTVVRTSVFSFSSYIKPKAFQ